MPDTKLKAPRGLPRKPSALIRRALEDLAMVERKTDVYEVDMGYYHAPVGPARIKAPTKRKCSVCFAGAVMAGAGNSPDMAIQPGQFSRVTELKLQSLDLFRRGAIIHGCNILGVETNLSNRWVPPYEVEEGGDPARFRKAMEAIVADLVREGH